MTQAEVIKVPMSRINHHLPKALHKQIRDIAFDADESTTVAINRAIENYVNTFGSEPAANTPKEPTAMDKHLAYQKMGLEGRLEHVMLKDKKEFLETSPNDNYDEEARRALWVKNINREIAIETAEAVA